MSDERDIKELITKFNKQQTMMNPFMRQPEGISPDMGTDQSPHIVNNNLFGQGSSTDQSPVDPVNSVRPMGTPIYKARIQPQMSPNPAAPSVAQSSDACPQCGSLHPPLPPGTKCPMAKVKVINNGVEKVVDVNKFLANLKDIILSQCDKRKITDIEKLFKNIIVEIMKYLEGYKE